MSPNWLGILAVIAILVSYVVVFFGGWARGFIIGYAKGVNETEERWSDAVFEDMHAELRRQEADEARRRHREHEQLLSDESRMSRR